MSMLSSIAGMTPLLAAANSTSSAESNTVRAVDCHAHVFLRDLPMPDRRRAPAGYDAPVEQYLQQLDAHAISHGVLIQPSFLGSDNSYMLAALAQYPQRLRAIAVVEADISAAELDRLQRAGVVGIRLNLIGLATPDFSSAAWVRLLAMLKARRMQVEVHQLAQALQPVLEPLLAAGLNVVVDHFGRPDPLLGIADPGFRYLLSLGTSQAVWVKLSAAYRNGAEGRGEQIALAAMPLLLAQFGPQRLLWGSDWPHTLYEASAHYGQQTLMLEQYLPNQAARRIVLCDSPAALFGFFA